MFFLAIVRCPLSCFFFDGYAFDGRRIIMRDCGYFNTDDCVEDAELEGDELTIGTICHCKGDLCNGAIRHHFGALALILTLVLMTFIN